MSEKKSFLYGVSAFKCPRCRDGNMFPSGTLYSTRFADMHPVCPCCGQSFEPEPGYYYGAMYVSFAINVAIFLTTLVILSQFVEEVTMVMLVGIIVVTVIGLMPIIFRLSRVLWINIFIRYEGPCKDIPKRIYS
jgi:uncharacterized protein (DUF983 family)